MCSIVSIVSSSLFKKKTKRIELSALHASFHATFHMACSNPIDFPLPHKTLPIESTIRARNFSAGAHPSNFLINTVHANFLTLSPCLPGNCQSLQLCQLCRSRHISTPGLVSPVGGGGGSGGVMPRARTTTATIA